MTTQPEALRRILQLEAMHERGTIKRGHIDEMLAELRRLHEANQELLEVLKEVVAWMDAPDESAFSDSQLANLRAAIAKHGGQA